MAQDPKRPAPQKNEVELEDPTDPGIELPLDANPKLGGPLEALMKDPAITEIMINDVRNVMVERDGKISISGFTYSSTKDLNDLVRKLLQTNGKALSPDSPYVDIALPDGSRVNIVGPPLTTGGPCLTIRKFPARRLSIEDLINNNSLDRRVAVFLNACVAGRMNILISGGTGSGKSTLLNALTAFIPKSERIITIEDIPELCLSHANSVRLQTKPQSPGSPPITARDLVANALRMRPDRIIVGECRRGEAFDMLQAMNTGHAGSMTTIHANSPRDALSRLETLCMLSDVELPLIAVRKQIANALDLVVQVKRFRTGNRHVVAIAEVTGIESDTLTLQDVFKYELATKASNSDAERGTFRCTGLVPTFIDRLKDHGVELPQNFFA